MDCGAGANTAPIISEPPTEIAAPTPIAIASLPKNAAPAGPATIPATTTIAIMATICKALEPPSPPPVTVACTLRICPSLGQTISHSSTVNKRSFNVTIMGCCASMPADNNTCLTVVKGFTVAIKD